MEAGAQARYVRGFFFSSPVSDPTHISQGELAFIMNRLIPIIAIITFGCSGYGCPEQIEPTEMMSNLYFDIVECITGEVGLNVPAPRYAYSGINRKYLGTYDSDGCGDGILISSRYFDSSEELGIEFEALVTYLHESCHLIFDRLGVPAGDLGHFHHSLPLWVACGCM